MKKLYGMKEDDIVTAITKFRELYEEKGALLDCSALCGVGELLSLAKATAMYLPSHRASGAFCEADH